MNFTGGEEQLEDMCQAIDGVADPTYQTTHADARNMAQAILRAITISSGHFDVEMTMDELNKLADAYEAVP